LTTILVTYAKYVLSHSLNLSYRETYGLTHTDQSPEKFKVFDLPWKNSETNFGIWNAAHFTRTRQLCKANTVIRNQLRLKQEQTEINICLPPLYFSLV
jgi:hypothetical protein